MAATCGSGARAVLAACALLIVVLVRRLSRPACTPQKELATATPSVEPQLRHVHTAVVLPAQGGSAAKSGLPKSGGAIRGHEWIGGAVGYAERPGNTERRYAAAHPPRNASLLLIGVVSGSKNFDVRNWVRRAFWLQRPWRLGVDWRFVVGTSLPHGDNDRVSLHYEATKHGDIDMVRGSELPPRQARVALRWLVHAAALSAREAGSAPRYIGLTYDALLISLPRLATRLRALGPAIERGVEATSGRPSSAYSDGARTAGFPSMTRRLVYGGSLRWAAWADGASGGATWRCVRAAAPAELLSARLVGDSAPSHEELGAQARRRAERRPSCGDVSRGRAFLAAAPELQLLSTQLLQRASAALLRRLHVHRLEVAPPSELWDRSLVHHQSAAGRTPAPPALLAATAIARAVANVSAAHRGAVTYLQLRSAVNVPPFSWEMDPPKYPGVTSLLARAVTDGVMAEAVAERFTRQRAAAVAGAGRLRCGRERCAAWGMSEAAPPHGQALCCEERPQPAAHAAAGAR